MICGIRVKWPSRRRTPLYPVYIMGVSVLNSQPVQFNFSTVRVLKIISVKRGNLFKWTNYLSGWQCRYVVVERGTLSYYRNELDMEFGCRGVIHLGRLFILFSPPWPVDPSRTARVKSGASSRWSLSLYCPIPHGPCGSRTKWPSRRRIPLYIQAER